MVFSLSVPRLQDVQLCDFYILSLPLWHYHTPSFSVWKRTVDYVVLIYSTCDSRADCPSRIKFEYVDIHTTWYHKEKYKKMFAK